MWGYVAFKRLRQEKQFEVNLGYIVRPCAKAQQNGASYTHKWNHLLYFIKPLIL